MLRVRNETVSIRYLQLSEIPFVQVRRKSDGMLIGCCGFSELAVDARASVAAVPRGWHQRAEAPAAAIGVRPMDQQEYLSLEKQSYSLASGVRAAPRLSLLNEIFGSASQELLTQVGLRSGQRVAEIGCGTGLMTRWIAQQVGPEGSVYGIDISDAQLAIASENASSVSSRNIYFREAPADATGLPRGSFDVVYSRFLMCHLLHPDSALREMWALLSDGGVLVCEDFEMSAVSTRPPTPSYDQLLRVSRALDERDAVDSDIGAKLHTLFIDNGCGNPEVSVYEPAFLRGELKHFWRITLEEAAPTILGSRIATAEEISSLCEQLGNIARNDSILLIVARVYQVWSRKT
ncbi:MAG TPA: methyltransferase domain-containing protein [Candidatus Acidoferrum sp.]|nr:methyltransferase domain-containing protein [Candidatus Acidoferrum sp.]